MAVQRGWRLAPVVALVCLCVSQVHVGLAQTPERCVLSGTVLNSATSAAIAHALVSYNGSASGFRFTDVGGGFQVADVPCGQYWLDVSKPGFLSEKDMAPQFTGLFNAAQIEPLETEAQAGRSPQSAVVAVDVKPKAPAAQIRLVPLSSIAGFVIDENSEPLAGVSVQGIAVKASLDGPDYVPARTAHTDDRGGYAFLDLPPGDYVVRLAGEASSTRYFMGSRLSLNNDHRGMQPVYYPNGDSPASASVLHLRPGERANADFRQTSEPAFNIDGWLTNLSPGAWTRLQLYRDGDRLPLGAAFVNASSGQFRIVDVPRGRYTLRAVQYIADRAKWLAAEAPVTVSSEPIRNLTVELSGGADILVSVTYEAGAQPDGQFQLMLQPQHTRDNARHLLIGKMPKRRRLPQQEPAAEAESEPTQTLFTDVIPDQYRLTVQTMGNDSDYVAAAKLGELDVLRGEFPVGAGAGGELHVTIRGDSGSVEGKVTFQGQPALGTQVYLIPARGAGGGLKTGFSDAEGSYHIRGVAPGDYRIQAWRGSPTAADILSGSGEKLTLQPGEHRTLALQAASGSDQSHSEGGIIQ